MLKFVGNSELDTQSTQNVFRPLARRPWASRPIEEMLSQSEKTQNVVVRSLADSSSKVAFDDRQIPFDMQKKISKCVRFNPFVAVSSSSRLEPAEEHWYSKTDEGIFNDDRLIEFQIFHQKNLDQSSIDCPVRIRINIQKFNHQMNFPSSYLEGSPSKIDLLPFRNVQNVLEARFAEPNRVPLVVRQSIAQQLKKENNRQSINLGSLR